MCLLVYSLPSVLDSQLYLDRDRVRLVHSCVPRLSKKDERGGGGIQQMHGVEQAFSKYALNGGPT